MKRSLKTPRLTAHQFERISNIFDNAGQVIFAGSVLAPIIDTSGQIRWEVVISGVLGIVFCWIISIWFAKKGK